MASLRERLIENKNKHGIIKVGLVGAGQMGAGLMSQMEKMDGMAVVAVADARPGRSKEAYGEARVNSSLVHEVDDLAKAAELIADGRRVATTSGDFLTQIENLDVIVEATGIPEIGAQICYAAIQRGKNIVNMNVEADATIGYLLGQKAKEAGVVYSLVAGDEPGSLKELFDFADALGFEIVTVGKGKNNYLDHTSNPETAAADAKRQNMSPKMLASFRDGSKTMVEMTSIGNAIGFAPEVRGAYGPQCTVKELPKVFVPKVDGGIFENKGAVDYAVGDVAPGVFVIITTDQPKIMADLKYLRLLGHGNYWTLYRPYHLANLETPITVANVALYRQETLVTLRKPVAETVTIAKRDLKAGEKVDALGGFTVYGVIEKASVARAEELLPLGLAIGATINKHIPMGQALRYGDVDLNEEQLIVKLRREQDAML